MSFPSYSQWVDQGLHRPLLYLSDERKDKRQDLKNVFPEFQSAMIFLFSYANFKKSLQQYYTDPSRKRKNLLKMAGFALAFQGKDYHYELKTNLQIIGQKIEDVYPGIKNFCSLDVHPVLERDMAFRSGLGWFGKNSMLISRQHGSYFMLGSLLLSQKLPLPFPRYQETDHCGVCTQCIDACPTQAIDGNNRTLIAEKCISTFTIEIFKDNVLPPPGYTDGQGEIFGCDICQDVCPWNKKVMRTLQKRDDGMTSNQMDEHSPALVLIRKFFFERDLKEVIEELKSLSNRKFRQLFQGTSLERTGRKGILKNLLPFL